MRRASGSEKQPYIFHYFDYRKYLQDIFNYWKSHSSVFSNRYIVKKAGFSSPTMLAHVMHGRRNLSVRAADRFARAFRLNGGERRYFLKLVALDSACSLNEKERLLEELLALKNRRASQGAIDDHQMEYLSRWWHPVIREALMLPDAKKSSKWIGRILVPSIAPAEAKRSVVLLQKLGFIKKENGKWTGRDAVLSTDPQVQSVKAAQFHRSMIRLGAESIARFSSNNREISGTTLRFAAQDMPRFISLIREFRKKLLRLATSSKNADRIYQFNCQFFPLVRLQRPRRLV